LQNVEVFDGRAEQCNFKTDLVMMRAVEKFAQSMMTGARLVAPGGRLVLLTGNEHVAEARTALPMFSWQEAVTIPMSDARVVLVGAL
jgi:16S rRNA G527 N7-methylase RsmG